MAIRFSTISLLFSVFAFGQGRIQGYIIDMKTGKPLVGTRVSLHVYVYDSSFANNPRYQENVRAGSTKPGARDTIYNKFQSTYSDSNGHYIINTVEPNIYRLSAFHQISRQENRLYGEFDQSHGFLINDCNGEFRQDFKLAVFCPYDATKNFTHCPKCKKKDKVLIIRYGLLIYPLKPEPGYYYNGYCVIPRCHPTKHCIRDRTEF